MSQLLYSEEVTARTSEICEVCERVTNPLHHLCGSMQIHSEAFYRAMAYESAPSMATRIVTCLQNTETSPPYSVRMLPLLATVAALCQWSLLDLRHIRHMGIWSRKVIETSLNREGLSLLDLSPEAAIARRSQLLAEARR